ncbi:MAG: hypothetical protein CFE43_06495 [Burkholderiales bacterium PBB3]|nr:MAG: hypothetical protein CFE43_06495 [Burkholderiales bacterium PBB3]
MRLRLKTATLRRVCLLYLAWLASAASANAADAFDPATGQLTIDAIVLDATLYRAVVVVPASVISFSNAPPTVSADSFDGATGRLTLRSVSVGGTAYSDVVLTVATVVSVGSATLTSQLDDATRAQAAGATATSSTNACAAIAPFYWEVGDKSRLLGSGSVNKAGSATSYTATSLMAVASASKWLYGSYVVERRNGQLTPEDVRFLTFSSGYTQMPVAGCARADTVASCAERDNNGVPDPATVDKFYYNGGHMQKHASLATGMNLGALDNAALAAEMTRVLGADVALAYSQPQLAGGVFTNAKNYAVLLRKLLGRQLQMSDLLGSHAVCTNPSTCPSAVYSPFGGSFHYSLGHWVEDDPVTGDGAFSSAGLFGFYPWINASKTYYGIVSRFDASGAGAGAASVACGARVRKAWMTGVALH